ncbi:Cullin-3 [Manis javanica]|nr:Cullin-3 [Manis javanica]
MTESQLLNPAKGEHFGQGLTLSHHWGHGASHCTIYSAVQQEGKTHADVYGAISSCLPRKANGVMESPLLGQAI